MEFARNPAWRLEKREKVKMAILSVPPGVSLPVDPSRGSSRRVPHRKSRRTPSSVSLTESDGPFRVIFHAFGSISRSIFVFFRGCIARTDRLSARRAQPLFLLAGAVLSRVHRLDKKSKIDYDRQQIAPAMLHKQAV